MSRQPALQSFNNLTEIKISPLKDPCNPAAGHWKEEIKAWETQIQAAQNILNSLP
jgi:hypothetical protein